MEDALRRIRVLRHDAYMCRARVGRAVCGLPASRVGMSDGAGPVALCPGHADQVVGGG